MTIFRLGDFYLSPILFMHILFVDVLVMPAALLVHEYKFQGVHEEFMSFVSVMIAYHHFLSGKSLYLYCN